MSENIQSISQGTYTIGNTNELTFSAGPGITIDQPTEGTVRIGTNNNTWTNITSEITKQGISAGTVSFYYNPFLGLVSMQGQIQVNVSQSTVIYTIPAKYSPLGGSLFNVNAGGTGYMDINVNSTTHVATFVARANTNGYFALFTTYVCYNK